MSECLAIGSELGRAEIRAALHVLQDGRCAVCGADGKLVVDHDHATGHARGLLCRPCNVREGSNVLHPDIQAYLADAPAAGRGWFWELPDAWSAEDYAAVARLGITIMDYMPQHLERAAARKAALERSAIDAMLASKWGREDDGPDENQEGTVR